MICLARKTPKDGKEEKHTSTGDSGAKAEACRVCRATLSEYEWCCVSGIDLLYAREEQQNNKE